jgi:hypothetical protein
MKGHDPLFGDPSSAPTELRRIGWDTRSGMLYSNVTAFLIILATATTLYPAGIIRIDTAAQQPVLFARSLGHLHL